MYVLSSMHLCPLSDFFVFNPQSVLFSHTHTRMYTHMQTRTCMCMRTRACTHTHIHRMSCNQRLAVAYNIQCAISCISLHSHRTMGKKQRDKARESCSKSLGLINTQTSASWKLYRPVTAVLSTLWQISLCAMQPFSCKHFICSLTSGITHKSLPIMHWFWQLHQSPRW